MDVGNTLLPFDLDKGDDWPLSPSVVIHMFGAQDDYHETENF